VAQQILTAAAKLRGQADPVIALASSSLLASLSMPDAHPSYLASSAAAVLASQLLQADVHDLPALLGRTDSGGSAPEAGSEAGPSGRADPGLRPALCQALQLATEGQLGRILASELGPNGGSGGDSEARGMAARAVAVPTSGAPRIPRSHLPLALVALVQATSTDSSKIHFADRVKHNLRKVGAHSRLSA
jgi:hypothetical protein